MAKGGAPRSGTRGRSLGPLLVLPVRDAAVALDRAVGASRRPWTSLLLLLAAATGTWFLYVPLHEMLHVAGCRLSGGEVRKVAIAPIYGGRLLSEWLPFVEVSSEHAGRLTEFSTGRSDLRYLATSAAPYLLSIVGVPLLRAATRRRSALWAGAAIVLALAPFVSLTGDYYEIGSILVTRAPSPLEPPPEPYSGAAGLMSLRSDDLPALVRRIAASPRSVAAGVPGGLPVVVGTVTLSAALGLILALATYALGHFLSCRMALRPEPLEAGGGHRG